MREWKASVNRRRVVVVDSDRSSVALAEVALASIPADVVGTAASLDEATGVIAEQAPEIVIVDARREGETSVDIAWLARTRTQHPGTRLIAFSALAEPGSIRDALAAGADAYVVKSSESTDLAAAVRQTEERSFFVPADAPPVSPRNGCAPALTRREVEILRLAAQGMSNGAIAKQLWVTQQTVKFHLANVYRKLGVTNRTGAARQAELRGLFGGR